MMKLLYNVDKLDQDDNPLKPPKEDPDLKTGEEILKSNLLRRESFSYRMIDYWRSFSLWCCCCRRKFCKSCKCCYHQQSIKDKLFIQGRTKLHSEIDLLHIIKTLRVTNFGAQTVLKPH